MILKPFIIPFFIPHEGCPHRCVFCDQHKSAGARLEPVSPENVAKGIEQALTSPKIEPGQLVEAAFFGGTFTALPRSRQEELLAAAAPFVQNGRVNSLRVSTRPDAIDEDRLSLLKYYHVRTVELGAQSMDDRVLFAAERGHTADDTRRAAGLIRGRGLRLGIQLLIGLPEEDEASRALTLRETLALNPDDARIYPVLVIRGTALESMYRQGRYQPLELRQAVDISADYYTALTMAGANVIRLGLHAEPKLAENTIAGPIHPAFGELVKSEVYYRALKNVLVGALGNAPVLSTGKNLPTPESLRRGGVYPRPLFSPPLDSSPAPLEGPPPFVKGDGGGFIVNSNTSASPASSGLQTSPDYATTSLEGPPPFVKGDGGGFIVNRNTSAIPQINEIQVAPQDLSQAQGHQKTNLAKLRQLPGRESLTIRPNPNLGPGCFLVGGRQFSVLEKQAPPSGLDLL